jgi:MFS family permease
MNEAAAAGAIAADSEHRRNALLLAAAAAVNGAIPSVLFTLGGLAGLHLLGPDKSLATLPLTGYTVGVALGAIPAAALMRATGRRLGFMAGALIGILAGIGSGAAVVAGSFPALVIAMAAAGFSGSFTQQYRFAAADGGDAAFRARAISWVLSGGIVASVLGPQTVIATRDLLAPIPFAGAFFASSGLALLGVIVLSFLTGAARSAPPETLHSGGRPLTEIARQPRFVIAVICAMGSYSLMTLVMTAGPLAMVGSGLGQDNAALGIQWHGLAMYGPSFFTGTLIARFGKEGIVALGLALLAGSAAVALAGIDVSHFWLAIILLGVGWNFAFIAATAMVTETYRPEEKARVQGLNDFLVFGLVAFASFASGKLFGTVGWTWINLAVFPVVLICALALSTKLFGRRHPARQP